MIVNRPRPARVVLLGSAATLLLLSVHSEATDNLWTGAISGDWNEPGNWSLGRVPVTPSPETDGFEDAIINTIPSDVSKIATINVDPISRPRDFRTGVGVGNSGQVNHNAGTASTGDGNWFYVGYDGGTGKYNLSNTATTGGTFTGLGQGSGSLNIGGLNGTAGRLYIGQGVNGNGTMNVNTTGTITVRNDIRVGESGGTGVLNVDSGTITSGGYNFFGVKEAAEGGNGRLNMSGGSITNTGRTYVGQSGTTGAINLTGGTYNNVNNELFIIGENANSNGSVTVNGANAALNVGGELWVGQGAGGNGLFTLSAGTVTVNSWFAVGREGATGVLNMTGGTFTKTGPNQVVIGSLGGSGTVNQSGGSFSTLGAGGILLGESPTATSLWDLSGGTVQTEETRVGWKGGTSNELRVRNSGSWSSGFINVGDKPDNVDGGKGIVNQTGGTISANTWIAVGIGSSQQAEYNLSGGTTNAAGFEVGADSSGLVSVSANGILNVSGSIEVPTRNGSGLFNISGGTVNTTDFLQGGRNSQTGTGVTNQTGGVVNISNNLDVQRLNVGTGTYNLSGGTLSVNGAINVNLGVFTFTGGRITRSTSGTITFNGNLTTGTGLATLDLDADKLFDINGVFNVVAGITFDLTGKAIPAWGGVGVDTGSFTLGTVDSIVGTFDPSIDTITGLAIDNPFGATFISEAAGEGQLFNASSQSVYWIQESAGLVTLNYSLVPEPGSASLLALAGLALGVRRRRRK